MSLYFCGPSGWTILRGRIDGRYTDAHWRELVRLCGHMGFWPPLLGGQGGWGGAPSQAGGVVLHGIVGACLTNFRPDQLPDGWHGLTISVSRSRKEGGHTERPHHP